VIDSY